MLFEHMQLSMAAVEFAQFWRGSREQLQGYAARFSPTHDDIRRVRVALSGALLGRKERKSGGDFIHAVDNISQSQEVGEPVASDKYLVRWSNRRRSDDGGEGREGEDVAKGGHRQEREWVKEREDGEWESESWITRGRERDLKSFAKRHSRSGGYGTRASQRRKTLTELLSS